MTETTNGIARLHQAVARGKTKGIALMSHVVVGYPSLEQNEQVVAALAAAGVETMELQFPFSDPLADGPVLTKANQTAVASGISVDQCMAFAASTTKAHPDIAFLIMTYANVLYRRGIRRFVEEARDAGIAGIIVPDMPPEQATELRESCAEFGIGTVFLVTPLTTSTRLQEVAAATTGFVYCVGRPGVTGEATAFDQDMLTFIDRVREAADVPVGVGFGIRMASDVDAIRGTSDIAIVGTESIRRVDADGVERGAEYIGALRSS